MMPQDCFERELLDRLVAFDEIHDPATLLHALNEAISRNLCLSVLGAGRFPLRMGDWQAIEKGRTVFIHESVPSEWWDEYMTLSQRAFDPGLMMARLSLSPFTWTESRRMIEPLGIDQWPYELALKYRMRDGLTCPVGARWVVAFWSPKVLSDALPEKARALIFLAANFAAMQLEKLVAPDPKRVGRRAPITPRELAVLRLLSMGRRTKEIAEHLGLGEETIRTHLKKAQEKLGARDRTQAVAEAIRQHLMP